MTGRLPIRLGLAGAGWEGGVLNSDAVGGLPANETTIAEALKDIGYATKAIGKWHLGQQPQFLPTAHGFDEYYGIPYSDDMGSSAWRYYNSEDRPPLPLIHSTKPGEYKILEQPTDLNLLSGRYMAESKAFIDQQTKAGTPWLLYMAFNHVHVPDFASPDFCNKTLRGRFGDALMELDFAVGRIMDGLRASGAESNTLVFFTSDNGPWLTQSLAGGSAGLLKDGKTTTWEGGVREPGMAYWPGRIAPGRISTAVVATYDIFVTAIKLAGGKLPEIALDGRDMSPVLFNASNDASPHDCVYHWRGAPGLSCPDDHPDCPGLWAVRCGAYKAHWVTKDSIGSDQAVKYYLDKPLLYNLEVDPSEMHPIPSSDPRYAEQMPTIKKAATAHEASIVAVPNQMRLGTEPKLKICCDWNSTRSYPKFPTCTCNPDNFHTLF
eukprot:1918125-Prymnesium_polylepis.1